MCRQGKNIFSSVVFCGSCAYGQGETAPSCSHPRWPSFTATTDSAIMSATIMMRSGHPAIDGSAQCLFRGKPPYMTHPTHGAVSFVSNGRALSTAGASRQGTAPALAPGETIASVFHGRPARAPSAPVTSVSNGRPPPTAGTSHPGTAPALAPGETIASIRLSWSPSPCA